jgi:hypothetical protein
VVRVNAVNVVAATYADKRCIAVQPPAKPRPPNPQQPSAATTACVAAPIAPIPPAASAPPRYDESLAVLASPAKKNLMLDFTDAAPATAVRESAVRFKVVAYYPMQFAELRRRVVVGGELAFVLSLSRCKRWHPRGGKSTAYFAKTHDERFVIKQLSRPEKARAARFSCEPGSLRVLLSVPAAACVAGRLTTQSRAQVELEHRFAGAWSLSAAPVSN